MIPKTIHYCWFGHKPLPRSAQRCLASWHKYFPDYEIKEWNESNFDTSANPYCRDAYADGKYAYVSDYARFLILYRYGGLYFDTDVRVIRPMDDIVERGAFMGMEQLFGVAPGLCLGAEAGHPVYKEMIDFYDNLSYRDANGHPIQGMVVPQTTAILRREGLVLENKVQQVANIWVYPSEYFDPLDDATGRLRITPHTRSIHLYTKTWADHYGPCRIWLTRWAHRLLGVNFLSKLKK